MEMYIGSDVTKEEALKIAESVKVTPVAFLIIKEGNVRMLPVATPANTTADRLVEMVPDVVDKVSAFIDSHTKKAE